MERCFVEVNTPINAFLHKCLYTCVCLCMKQWRSHHGNIPRSNCMSIIKGFTYLYNRYSSRAFQHLKCDYHYWKFNYCNNIQSQGSFLGKKGNSATTVTHLYYHVREKPIGWLHLPLVKCSFYKNNLIFSWDKNFWITSSYNIKFLFK